MIHEPCPQRELWPASGDMASNPAPAHGFEGRRP
jgi:hypothetical protein